MKKYMSERKMTEKYINSISKFGYKDYKPTKTILKVSFFLVYSSMPVHVENKK